MEVKEAKSKKYKLEADIMALIRAYNKETGLYVVGFEFVSQTAISVPEHVHNVRVLTTL